MASSKAKRDGGLVLCTRAGAARSAPLNAPLPRPLLQARLVRRRRLCRRLVTRREGPLMPVRLRQLLLLRRRAPLTRRRRRRVRHRLRRRSGRVGPLPPLRITLPLRVPLFRPQSERRRVPPVEDVAALGCRLRPPRRLRPSLQGRVVAHDSEVFVVRRVRRLLVPAVPSETASRAAQMRPPRPAPGAQARARVGQRRAALTSPRRPPTRLPPCLLGAPPPPPPPLHLAK